MLMNPQNTAKTKKKKEEWEIKHTEKHCLQAQSSLSYSEKFGHSFFRHKSHIHTF